MTPKTYPALKTFVAYAYTCRILSQWSRNMERQMGYVLQTHNMYTVLDNNNDATSATDGTTTTLNVVTMMTENTLTGAHTMAVPESIANAINQLSANQMALMAQISQIVAMSLAQRPQAPSFQATHAPPIQQIVILAIQPFSGAATGGFQAGTAAVGGRGGRNRCNGRGGWGAGAEADEMTVRHLPPTNRNRSSKNKDTEQVGSCPKDRQDSYRRHRPGVTINQQRPRSTS